MIVDLPDTTTSKVSKALVTIREDGGAVALGRVLTLVIAASPGAEEEAIEAANDASREHPMRVIVLSSARPEERAGETSRLDAQIRVGGDAGASEVVVLRAYGETASDQESLVTALLLSDAPVVAWWPGTAPDEVAAVDLGRIATRRITDASTRSDPRAALERLCEHHHPGDTDFSWTRLTLWRAQLAAVLDQPPHTPVTGAVVSGAADSPSTLLLAAWLRLRLEVPVRCELSTTDDRHGIHGVRLERPSGDIVLEREIPALATLTQPGQPVHDVTLPRRSLHDLLTEELRHLDPDVLYGEVVTRGLPLLESEQS